MPADDPWYQPVADAFLEVADSRRDIALAGVEDQDAMGPVGHKSLRVASDYNVKSVLRLTAALDRVIAFENPRYTRASGASGEPGSPL